jgi:YD repeat-containing protein
VDSAGRTLRVGSTADVRIASLEVKNAAEQGRWVVFASYTYDEHGNATYRADGHIVSRTDPMGATTAFERDERGRLVSVKDPLGRVTAVERDGNGLPIEITDPAGGVTRIERDPRGNAVLVTDAADGVSSYRHDARGLLTEAVAQMADGSRSTRSRGAAQGTT